MKLEEDSFSCVSQPGLLMSLGDNNNLTSHEISGTHEQLANRSKDDQTWNVVEAGLGVDAARAQPRRMGVESKPPDDLRSKSKAAVTAVDENGKLSSIPQDSLAHSSLPLVFNGIDYQVKSKRILRDISGQATCGRLLALMGPTGSGKTTLLNILAHRVSATKGSITYGPYAWSKALKQRLGVVEQDDIVLTELTVRQSLRFTAQLRLPREFSLEEKFERVEEVIQHLRLENCADTKIGDGLVRGISGGERKRLCIASEFLTRPKIVLFDEPTSGLDSTMAKMVVGNMRSIAREGVVVVSSIHQPSSEVFEMFDDVILLDKGQLVYQGEVKKCSEPFNELGHTCPEHYNPADFMMDVIVLERLTQEQRNTLIKQHSTCYPQPSSPLILKETTRERYSNSWMTQVWILTRRGLITIVPEILDKSTLTLQVGIAVLTGILWFDLGFSEADIYPKTSLALWTVGTWMFFPILGSLSFFSSRMVMLKKELNVNSYRLSAFFVAQTSVSMLPFVCWATIWLVVTYAMSLGPSGTLEQFVLLYLAILLDIVCMQSIGLAISAVFDEDSAVTFTMVLITFFFGYAGLFVPLASLPEWISWSYYVNFLAYMYELVMRIVLVNTGVPYECLDTVSSTFEVCTRDSNETSSIGGEDVLESVGLILPAWASVTAGLVGTIIFRIIAYRVVRWEVSKHIKS